MTLVILFWVLTLAILSVRGALIEGLPFPTIVPRRVVAAAFGAVLCYGASRYFESRRFRSFAHRLWVGFFVALLLSVLLTAFHMMSYRFIPPVPPPEARAFSLNDAAQWVITWLGYMMAWTGIHLALLYHWEVNQQQRQYAAMREHAQESRIAALRYQINPHFLFNSLNSISALVSEDEKERAEKMIVSLAEFFRATMSSSPSSTVTLDEEIDLQLLYLRVEEIRFAGRMKVRMTAPEELLSTQVPPLILQPLVENAVRHGVEMSECECEIEIGASAQREGISIFVENRGCSGSPGVTGAQVGLKNVRDRLRAHYGEAAELHAGATAGGFRASVTVPAKLA